MTPSEAREFETGVEGASINLFPDASETSPVLMSVPVARIIPPIRMPNEDGNPFPFRLA